MTFRTFIIDRIPYIAVYAFNVFLLALVIQLDILRLGVSLQAGNLLYMGILSTTLLTILLSVDFLRQRQFYRQSSSLLGDFSDLEDVLKVQSGVTCEQKALQRMLLSHHAQYEKELANHRTRQSQHNHFITQWAHAMKTPVSVIDLLTQQSANDENCDDLLASVQEENDKLASGLEMMLHVARLEKFELDLHVSQVDILQLIREVINSHKKELIRYDIFPKVESNTDSILIETDRKWMAFVFNQMISNAIKYTQGNKEEKRIFAVIDQSSDKTVVTIRDTGIGVPPQDIPRVFEPFFTGENGRQTSESTGMGLHLAKEVCQRLGHRIFLDSEVAMGTEVVIEFATRSVINEALKESK